MDATTVAVDLAKSIFELAVADEHWHIVERQRLSRPQFERWFANRAVSRVVMEACGSAHHWARWLTSQGIEVQLLPPRYVRPYVKRNKTDAADAAALADPATAIPTLLRETMRLLLEEIRLLEARIAQLERELATAARASAACTTLLSVPGVGLLTATALVAATGGSVAHFKDARHFASWFGLTPKEHSSGGTLHLGRISKRGDRYLRMLLTHGARSVLHAATVAQRCGKPLEPLRFWALANKLARICYATLRDSMPFEKTRLAHKLERQAFPMPL